MERTLDIESVEGEIALVIEYKPGQSEAVAVLAGAMRLIESLDRLDRALLSSVDTALEPVSILNDVQHSSLKILLARALRKIPDELVGSLDWKKWVGGLLMKGKYVVLEKLEADAPEVQRTLDALRDDYRAAPDQLAGFDPPRLVAVIEAIDGVNEARAALGDCPVVVQTEMGDILLPRLQVLPPPSEADVAETITNRGREYLKVKSPDMLGLSQWAVVRAGRVVRVEVLHRDWLALYQAGKIPLLPGDSLDCAFEESIDYDAGRSEVARRIAVVEIFGVIRPPRQDALPLP